MAEKEQKPKGDTVVLLNRGLRTYHTSGGLLAPGGSVELPKEEAAKLSVYRDLQDASKAAPQQAAKQKGLELENEKLRKQLAELSAGDPDATHARIAELEALLDTSKKENEELADKVEKLQTKIEKLKDK